MVTGVARSAATAQARYCLAFTTGGLFASEAPIAAALYGEHGDWAAVRERIEADNLLQARTVSAGKRRARELIQRLSELSDGELNILTDAISTERAQLMWVAACRRYTFIAEFAGEVVRERFLLLTPTLAHEHFDAFWRSKTLWHDELSELSPSTVKRLRSNLFLMLRQADLLTDNGDIIPALLSNRVELELTANRPNDVRLFPGAESTRTLTGATSTRGGIA